MTATYAPWRAPAGLADGQVVKVGDILPDVFAGNGMTRTAMVSQAKMGDVVWSADKHYLSSAPVSVRFLRPGSAPRSRVAR